MEAAAAHRRSQSDAAGSDTVLQDVPQAPGHVRSVSLGSSASQFLQSLKLQDPAALQHSAAPADQYAVQDQHTPAAGGDNATGTASAAAQEWSAGQQSARSKRTHRGSSNGHASSDAMQLDVELPGQQPHGFTPLPAVVEHSPLDSERDWDSDSDREGFGPNRRGSRAGGRRGGCNGRSESELMLLDPKRVKRILANRESAARSKERRVNYTMLLEGQLQDLSVETERLSTQLHSLSKQEGKLKNSKAELEQQVCTMQQQLAQAVSENQALVGVLFQLQAAMGLPQSLPDCMQASTQYQQSWQAYDYQAPTCTQPVSSPKQRKPRRQSKHQQQQQQQQQQQDKHQQQQQQQPDMWAGSSYAGSVEPDMNDPAAAAAAPVAELPVQLVSKAQAARAAAGQGRVEAAAAAAAAASAAPDVSTSALPSVGTTAPPSSATSSGRALQVSSKQHQWHTGLHSGGSNSNTPAAAPQLQASSTAAASALAASAAAQPVQCDQTAGTAGLSTATGATAAALLHQLPTPGADAVMGDAEDDITMLGVFLSGEDELDPAAAAATPAADVGTPAPAAAGMQSYAAGGTAGPDAALAAGWPGSAAGCSLPSHCSPQAATAAGAAPEVRPGSRRVFKTSPALSDPAGLDCWGRDDISSSSVGGSLTHSHTPNLTPSGRPCTEPVNGVNPAYARAGGWQQQQQYAASGQGGTHTGVSGTAAVSPQPAVAGAAAAGGRALAPEQLTTPHVSPMTPVSSRVRTPSATGAAAAAAAGMPSAYPGDALQANLAHHYQQQQGVGFMLGDAHAAAAGWGRGRHTRSASTGCVGGWQGYDQVGLALGPDLALQQQQHQQQEHQGASMLAAQLQLQQQQQHQQQGHALHAGHQAAAAVGTGAGAAPGPVTSVAGHHTQGPMPPDMAMGGLGPSQQVCWQRHRRSHSHAAAFMGQYELSMVQEQHLFYSGTGPTVVSHQGQPAQQGPP